MTTTRPAAIVLDWGATRLRALLTTTAGEVLGCNETDEGIQAVSGGAFEPALTRAIAPWRAAHGVLPIFAGGMIGSRSGWVEMPYVPAPAGAPELAAAVRRLSLSDGSSVWLLPGLYDPQGYPFPDVMRGEETQLVGLGLDRQRTVVLPGTHAKWARVGEEKFKPFRRLSPGKSSERFHAIHSSPKWRVLARLRTGRPSTEG